MSTAIESIATEALAPGSADDDEKPTGDDLTDALVAVAGRDAALAAYRGRLRCLDRPPEPGETLDEIRGRARRYVATAATVDRLGGTNFSGTPAPVLVVAAVRESRGLAGLCQLIEDAGARADDAEAELAGLPPALDRLLAALADPATDPGAIAKLEGRGRELIARGRWLKARLGRLRAALDALPGAIAPRLTAAVEQLGGREALTRMIDRAWLGAGPPADPEIDRLQRDYDRAKDAVRAFREALPPGHEAVVSNPCETVLVRIRGALEERRRHLANASQALHFAMSGDVDALRRLGRSLSTLGGPLVDGVADAMIAVDREVFSGLLED